MFFFFSRLFRNLWHRKNVFPVFFLLLPVMMHCNLQKNLCEIIALICSPRVFSDYMLSEIEILSYFLLQTEGIVSVRAKLTKLPPELSNGG